MVQEHVRYDTITEVQPVIHRQVEQVHVHHVEKHIVHAAPNMGGTYERPPLMQDHINHRFVTGIFFLSSYFLPILSPSSLLC
jgi:hypothetical protein